MSTASVRKARTIHRCYEGCRIEPGSFYVRQVALPSDGYGITSGVWVLNTCPDHVSLDHIDMLDERIEADEAARGEGA